MALPSIPSIYLLVDYFDCVRFFIVGQHCPSSFMNRTNRHRKQNASASYTFRSDSQPRVRAAAGGVLPAARRLPASRQRVALLLPPARASVRGRCPRRRVRPARSPRRRCGTPHRSSELQVEFLFFHSMCLFAL